MVSMSFAGLFILGLVGLGCVGAIAAVALAITLPGRRGEYLPHPPVVRCASCDAIRPASDTYCGVCGQALAPEK